MQASDVFTTGARRLAKGKRAYASGMEGADGVAMEAATSQLGVALGAV